VAADIGSVEGVPDTISREEAFEAAADASRPCHHGVSEELYRRFCLCSPKQSKEVMMKALPYSRYCTR
jgi:hypothetical protein